MRRLGSLLILALTLVAAGCSRHVGGTVTLDPFDNPTNFTQQFDQAFISSGRQGEYDIILVDSGGIERVKTPKKGPLQPRALAPMRQVVHIHCNWRPQLGMQHHPAALNSSITWMVLGEAGANDLVVYEGTGLVKLGGDEAKRDIRIRNAQVWPKVVRGGITDPIGQARIDGEVVARTNDPRVRETLAEMQKQLAQAEQSAGATNP
jgi:hypothetical protein